MPDPTLPEPALSPEARQLQAQRALGRIGAALERIEAAMARSAAQTSAPEAPPVPDNTAAFAELRQRHGALRIATAGALAQIDALITAHGKDMGKGEPEA